MKSSKSRLLATSISLALLAGLIHASAADQDKSKEQQSSGRAENMDRSHRTWGHRVENRSPTQGNSPAGRTRVKQVKPERNPAKRGNNRWSLCPGK